MQNQTQLHMFINGKKRMSKKIILLVSMLAISGLLIGCNSDSDVEKFELQKPQLLHHLKLQADTQSTSSKATSKTETTTSKATSATQSTN